jgi:hypothetical protein
MTNGYENTNNAESWWSSATRSTTVPGDPGPPVATPPSEPLRVLIVCDGYGAKPEQKLFTFSATVDKTDTFFTLTHFVETLRGFTTSTLPREPLFAVTLAHLDNDLGLQDPNGDPLPLLANTVVNAWFTWEGEYPAPLPPLTPVVGGRAPTKTPVELSDYDVIYLFGFEISDPAKNLCWDGGPLEDQVWAFVRFMESGRGIFATGDHEDRGARLCGSIPRVRSMRRWWWYKEHDENVYKGEGPYGWTYGGAFVFSQPVEHPFNRVPYKTELMDLCAPPAVGPWRLDTVRPGPQGFEDVMDAWTQTDVWGVPFDRQSDGIPQQLYVPRGPAHPILALPGGRKLPYLPDHMHEGLVMGIDAFGLDTGPEPSDVNQRYSYYRGGDPVAEFPGSGPGRPLPRVIAHISSEEHATPSSETVHVGALDQSVPFYHGAISVYDGTSEGVGRVVTEASFHHFLDLNLTGDPVTFALSAGEQRRGFTGVGSILDDLAMFWRNLTLWLAPRASRAALLFHALDAARNDPSIRMTARPEMSGSGHAVHDMGQMVVQHLDHQFPTLLLHDLVESAMLPAHAEAVNAVIAHRQRAVPHVAAQVRRVFLHGFLGGSLLHLLADQGEADEQTRRHGTIAAGLRGAGSSLAASAHAPVIGDLVQALNGFGAEGPPAQAPLPD